MFNEKIKKGAALISLMFIMSACGTNVTGNMPTQNNTGSDNKVVSSNPSNLTFSKVAESSVAEYNSLITKSTPTNTASAASGAAAPMVAAVGAGVSADAKMAPYMSYFPALGPFEEYTVTDFEEARTAGFSGTYIDTLNKIVKPIVQGLGNDARMTNSNGTSDANGLNKSDEPVTQSGVTNGGSAIAVPYPTYQQYQWQFTYVSSAKKEVYSIFVSTKETLVLKQKWGIKDLSPDDIKIDSSQAIKIVTDAVMNKSFTSPDSQQQYVSPGSETLYEIPKDTSWYLYLEKEKGRLIWNINMNIRYDYPVIAYDAVAGNETKPAIAPQAPEFWYSGGYARIDAASGNIITLTRPMKYRNVNPPMPVAAPDVAVSSSAGGSSDAVSPQLEKKIAQ